MTVSFVVRLVQSWERIQLLPFRDNYQSLLLVLTISLTKESWHSKDGTVISKMLSGRIHEQSDHVFHKHVDPDKTKKDQGNRSIKTFVDMCFKNETNMTTMIGILQIVKNEIKKCSKQIACPNDLDKIGNESLEDTLGEVQYIVLQRLQRSGRKWIQD